MNLLLLGQGKTGSIVADIAGERGHSVSVLDEHDNANAAGLTPQRLKDVDVVIDFTTPQAVIPNIEACLRAHKNMVVGTTGWYEQITSVKQKVSEAETGFLYAANF